jgi:activator of 2-hydroxyglutaryl-CoA dehydratase
MIHLQQKGTPDYEIIAGLCLAVARNFAGSFGRRGKLARPVAFLGGVAANAGMVRALATVLSLAEGELIRPQHFASLGAIGTVYESLLRN